MDVRKVRSDEARRTFRQILNEVERGGFVQILRYDDPAAVVVPVEWFDRATDALGENE